MRHRFALIGAIISGGVVAPVLLMIGLASTPASSASLLLNLESVLSTLLAWFVFHEHFDRRILLGRSLEPGGLASRPLALTTGGTVSSLILIL